MASFYSVFPAPWRISGAEIVDRDGEMVMGIDLEAEGSEAFFFGLVEAVNFHAWGSDGLPAHVGTELGVALAFVRDGGFRSAASVLRGLARWLERQSAARDLAAGLQAATVTPFHEAYPTPWRLADGEVVDRDGCNVQDFDDDPDTVDFWRCIVDAVNASTSDPINLAGSGPVPIEPREG